MDSEQSIINVSPKERKELGLGLKMAGKSEPSLRHPEVNEDAIAHSAEKGIAMLFDGVGGMSAGDKASRTAINFLATSLTTIKDTDPAIVKRKIESAMIACSTKVTREVPAGATTAVVAKFIDNGGTRRVIIGSVGDSRAYIFRDSKLQQITEDDSALGGVSLAEKRAIGERLDQVASSQDLARLSDQERGLFNRRNLIAQSLGDGEKPPQPHSYHIALKPGDVILLTSDGVHDNLTSDEIARSVATNSGFGKETALVNDLVGQAKNRSRLEGSHIRGKMDDISAVVVKVAFQ